MKDLEPDCSKAARSASLARPVVECTHVFGVN